MHSESVRLRTLTLKSVLNCGTTYERYTVQQLIDLGKKTHLRWIYCNYDKINFTEEVLKAIGQTIIISKPGVNKNAYIHEYTSNYYESYDRTKDEKMKDVVISKNNEKAKAKARQYSTNRFNESKSVNQAFNTNKLSKRQKY